MCIRCACAHIHISTISALLHLAKTKISNCQCSAALQLKESTLPTIVKVNKFYLWLLLTTMVGQNSIKDLHTVHTIVYPNFKDACKALILLEDAIVDPMSTRNVHHANWSLPLCSFWLICQFYHHAWLWHNITQPMSYVQLPWLHIHYEALGFWHLKNFFLNLLQGPWTQLINWTMLWKTVICSMTSTIDFTNIMPSTSVLENGVYDFGLFFIHACSDTSLDFYFILQIFFQCLCRVSIGTVKVGFAS